MCKRLLLSSLLLQGLGTNFPDHRSWWMIVIWTYHQKQFWYWSDSDSDTRLKDNSPSGPETSPHEAYLCFWRPTSLSDYMLVHIFYIDFPMNLLTIALWSKIMPFVIFLSKMAWLNLSMTEQTKWHVCLSKNLISPDIRLVWSVFAVCSIQSDQSLRCALNG